MKKKLILLGAGGAGREVLQIAKDIYKIEKNDWILHGFLDDAPDYQNKNIDGLYVIGKINEWVPKLDEIFVCSIANIAIRKEVISDYKKKGASFISLIHPTALINETAVFGEGLIMYPNSVLSSNVMLGSHVFINFNTTIGHDAKIGKNSVISSHCDVTGNVDVGECVFLGSHVTIVPNVKIGKNSIIGIGSVVVNNIKDNMKVFGNPAKSLKL
jgi:sugar O-acyltransferase (sialic acid O-acetyltransferase NeuD family)